MIGPRGENLIFAISQPRAGSTLLQRILAGHPAIFATAEPWLMLHPLYALRAQGHTADYNAEWARAALKDFCDNLEGGEQAYLEALRAMGVSLYNQALQRSGRPCFLDKTPRYYQICPELRRTFPEAKFILLLRNPLAVLSSMLTSWIHEDWERLELYQEDLLTAPPRLDSALRAFGSDAILLRYEEMVLQPDEVIRALCGRLGLSFDPAMIEYGGRPKPKGNMGDDVGIHRFRRPVTESKDKWLTELATPRRRLLAESYLAALDDGVLTRLGYPKQELLSALHAIPLSPSPDPLPAEAREHAAKLFRLSAAVVSGAARRVQQPVNPAAVALFMNGAPASTPPPQPPELPQAHADGGRVSQPANSPTSPTPLVSVIVSLYAAERYTRACLEDLIAQTIFDQTEILVIDSGSPENEGAIVREFQSRYQNIHYHRTERETLYAAWNRAIGLARGQYIANANADDAHRPDALELLVRALEAHPEADLAYGDYYTSSVPNDTFAQPHIMRHVVHPPYHPATVMMYCVTGCHPLWRRTVFQEVGLFDPSFTAPGDYEFLLRFVQAGRRAVHVPQPISLFYQNPDGLSWKSAAQTKNEGDRILGQYRTGIPIERIFKADPADPRSLARAWTALGNVALQHEMPWFSNYIQAVPYARMCYERALQLDPDGAAAMENLVIVHLLQPGQARPELAAGSSAQAALLNTLPPERAKIVRGDLASGQLRPVRVDVAAAVEPLEFGGAPKASLRFEPAILPDSGVTKPPSNETAPNSDGEKPAQPGVRLSVRLAAPFLNHTELAAEARNLALPLLRKVPLTTYDLSEPYSASFDAALPETVREALRVSRVGFNLTTGGVGICLQAPGRLSRMQGASYHVGRTAFEADRVREETARICNQLDELWVPSRASADALIAGGVEADKTLVLPPGVDVGEFDPERHPPGALPRRAAWNFLASFDWCTRKGWDVLLAAYLQEFSAQEEVCLYLQTRLGDRQEREARGLIERQLQEFIARLGRPGRSLPRVELLLEPIPPHQQPALYRAADCVVCPSRGESWNRTAHEAMAMGLPVIATRWGGHLDLVTEETGYLLDCETVAATGLDVTEWPYHGARWAEPSVAHLRELLRRVQRQPAEARERGVQARARVVQLFSSEVSSEAICARLQVIAEKLSKPSCPQATTRTDAPATPAAEPNTKTKLAVSLEGSFLDFGSLSHVNRELSRQLAKQPRIALTCVGKNVIAPELAQQPALIETARRLKYPAPKNAQVTLRHGWPPNWDRPTAGAWVLIQPWEYGVLPEDWTQRLTEVDEIWAPSDYVRRLYLESGVAPTKVRVVPNGIDPDRFHPKAKPLALTTRKKFKFLFVGGTIHRKGPDLLLQAYLENFCAADDVCLVIKDFGGQSVYAGQTLEAQIRAAQARPDAPEIEYLSADLAPDELSGLYTACDCLVHPYRGEGFGLPVLEAMACGLPVIVTGGGSTDDFATDEFAYRIPALRREIGSSVGGLKLIRTGWLLEPDLPSLAERMKWVAAYPEVARKKGEAASAHVRREWTWERAAQIAAQRLHDLLARRARSTGSGLAAPPPAPRNVKPVALPPAARLGHLGEARAHLEAGRLPAAWESALDALRLRPFHPEAFLLLAETAQAAGDAKRAKALADRARKMAPGHKPAQQFSKKSPAKSGPRVELPELPASLLAPAKPRLSVFLITKNEERFLGQCLQSILDVADQIIVADTGSTDWTRDIAGRYGAEVVSVEWTDDFSAARNAALERVTGDWVLMLDADEELLPGQAEALAKALSNPKAIAYRLPMIDQGREDEGVSYVPRLFRNAPGLFYVGRIHEQVFSSIEARRSEWGLENQLGSVRLLHHGYTKEIVRSRDKVARNLRLLQLALAEFPGEANLLMNLGLELVRAGYLHEGIAQYSAAFRALSALPPEEVVPELRETLLTQLCTHLMAVKDYAAIGTVLQSPLTRRDGLTATLHWLLGLACIECKQYAEGAEQMRQCLAKRDQPVLSPVNKNILKAGPNHCLALCLAALKQPEPALHAFQAAIQADPKARNVQFDYARFLAENGQGVEALKCIHQLTMEEPSNVIYWQFGGQVALSQPEFLEFAVDWTGEAHKFFPAHKPIVEQRAQALLLSGQASGALPLWRQLAAGPDPGSRAALLTCQSVLDQPLSGVPEEMALRFNQEFLAWYRRLLGANAVKVIHALNERLGSLRSHVPTAIQVIEAAMVEANQAEAV